MARALLSATALEVGYTRPLFNHLDLEVNPGEFWCFLGRNGAGKTTLVRTLLRLIAPLAGQLDDGAARYAYLPQRTRFDEFYPMSARDMVLMGTERSTSFIRRRSRQTLAAVNEALDMFQLEGLAKQRYRDLSEGQKQRVLLARAVASRPELAFLDEPTSAMDQLAAQQSYDRLDELRSNRKTAVVLVTHDLTIASERANRVLFIDDIERRVHVGAPEEVLANPALRRRYEVALSAGERV